MGIKSHALRGFPKKRKGNKYICVGMTVKRVTKNKHSKAKWPMEILGYNSAEKKKTLYSLEEDLKMFIIIKHGKAL